MTGDRAHSKPDGYWDRAGEQGYGQAMYRSSDVESHVRGRVWQTAIDIAGLLGVPATAACSTLVAATAPSPIRCWPADRVVDGMKWKGGEGGGGKGA